jgi:hypothetical protein
MDLNGVERSAGSEPFKNSDQNREGHRRTGIAERFGCGGDIRSQNF